MRKQTGDEAEQADLAAGPAVMALWAGSVISDRKPMPPDAKVYFIWPADGHVIPGGKFWVRMGPSNAGVAPAGTVKAGAGHDHLLVDCDLPPLDVPLPPLDEPIPTDENHPHYGLGQTEAYIDLPPGIHTLQLLMADGDHIPQNPPVMSKRVTIRVRAGEQPMATAQPVMAEPSSSAPPVGTIGGASPSTSPSTGMPADSSSARSASHPSTPRSPAVGLLPAVL